MQWVAENSAVFGNTANLLVALVWLAYLQLFFMAYRRRRRPMILINRGRGIGQDSHCLISNMSEEPIYTLCILAVIENDGENWVCAVTDDEDMADSEASYPTTHQGPLKQGDFMDVGSFDNMLHRVQALKRATTDETDDGRSIQALEVKVVALYSSSSQFIGASRRFEPSSDGQDLRPVSLGTQQLSGSRDRRYLKSLLRAHL